MSWCGGGEISATPGVEWRTLAIHGYDLVAGQLAAFAGLGALRHLDLQLVGVDEVLAGHAEARRRDLLDGAAARVAVGVAACSAPDPRRLRRCSTCRRCGSSRWRASRALPALIEPNDIAPVAKRLTMASAGSTSSSGTGVLGRLELEQPAQRAERCGSGRSTSSRELAVDSRSCPLRVACCSLATVSGLNRWCSPSRRHWYSPPDVEIAAARRPRAGTRARGAAATSSAIDVEADAADARRGPGEVAVDELLLEADRLEDLRAAVALQRRDAHLRHHLEHALVERLDVVLHRLLVRRRPRACPGAIMSSSVSNARYGLTAPAP